MMIIDSDLLFLGHPVHITEWKSKRDLQNTKLSQFEENPSQP